MQTNKMITDHDTNHSPPISEKKAIVFNIFPVFLTFALVI